MRQSDTPEKTYNQQLSNYSLALDQLKKKRTIIGWLRLLLFLVIVFLTYRLFIEASIILGLLLATGIAGFLLALTYDANNNSAIAETTRLIAINREELEILSGNYTNREDGAQFSPKQHPYSGDIDLFGKASLYQYINRCTSQQSKKQLATLLLKASNKDDIIEKQEAAKALSLFVEWRQKLQAEGMADPLSFDTEQKIQGWLTMPKPLQASIWKVYPQIHTIVTCMTIAALLLDKIGSEAFWLLMFCYFLVAKITSGKVTHTYHALSKIENEIATIYRQLLLVEHTPANSKLLTRYKEALVSNGGGTGSIRALQQILKRFDFRLNVLVFIILNTLFLWDVRQAIQLNKWKDRYGSFVHNWFQIVSDIEIISTLATLTFNHPGWTFPTIADDYFTLKGQQIGHPLIAPGKRVNNDFAITGNGKVTIITGSNMAGKSTFLRSVAVNLVLAQMGAPVCATAFVFSPVKLFTSMRIADNLAENTSTFYAELLKLKVIIEQVKQHEPVFILLDEILRGTNSLDRHTGSEALVKQLLQERAVGVVATHDVELAALENAYPGQIENYHFDVQVEGEELFFDYKLKAGVCQSLNASLLMRKIGIEL